MIDVAFVIGNLNKEHGGAQQLLFDICRHLPDERFDTTVYFMFGEGTYRELFERHGTTVVDLQAKSNYDLRAFYRLVSHLHSGEHDILHTNSPISGVWGRTAGKLGNIPEIVSVEHNVHTAYPRFTRLVNGVTLPPADAVVGVSRTVSESYYDWETRLMNDSTRRITIRNGIDIENINQRSDRSEAVIEQSTPFSPSDFVIGSVGRLHEQKGFEHLVRSFPRIREECRNARLLIIGGGPQLTKLQRISNRTGYQDDIHFTNYVPDVYPFVFSFDVAVFPSLWEGCPLSPMESMAAKRPIVATDIPPFREVIGDAGILVEPKDESALAEAVVSLYRNEERRRELGERGYERAVENFSIQRTVDEYADLYRQLADE